MDKELRILILEDDPADAELEEHELRKAGIAFISKRVETKETFLREIKDFDPDIILSDYNLLSFDGLTALTIAKEKCPYVPFVLVTGVMGEEFAIEILKKGATDYVLKSNLQRIVPVVNRALQEAEEKAERRLAEEMLREREAFIRTVLDNLPVGIAVNSVDPAVKFDYMNDNFPKFYRTSRKALAGPDAFWEAVYEDPAFRAEMRKRILDDCAGGDPARMLWADVPITRKGDETTFITAQNILLPGKQAMISLVWDVTERKLTEKAIQESEERYSTMFNSSPNVAFVHKGGVIHYVNEMTLKVFGYTRDEVIGKTVFEFIADDSKDLVAKNMQRRLAGEDIETYEVKLITKSKEIRYFLLNSSVIPYEKEKAFLVILSDITERKKLEAQLLQAQKMEAVGQLAGGVAHDFNNILQAIIGYGHVLKMKMREDDPLKSYADHVLSLSDRAANLTHSLLAFSRKQLIDPRPIDLNEIIRKVDKLLSRIIGEDIQSRMALSGKDLIVMADPMQIEQALMNLAANARDAMPEGGYLTIGTETVAIDHEFIIKHGYGIEGNYALMAVTDTGAGMDAETSEKIFQPFFTTKEVGKGTGLGLSMVYGIIKQNNGYINVYSEPEQGTTFKIYLPLIREKADEIKPEVLQPVERGTETVLLAEDAHDVRVFTKMYLEELGYKVIEAVDGEDAINKFTLDKDKIQLVLLDVIMPKKNGKEVYYEIKKIRPDIKALFMSGYTADVMSKQGIIEKGFKFILKPFSPTKLSEKIREVLKNEV
jgi:PAS domain S-box-containing protein